MRFLILLDSWLLDRIERACHAVQRQWGITNFQIAKGAWASYFLVNPAFLYWRYWDHETPLRMILGNHAALLFLDASMAGCFLLLSIFAEEEVARSQQVGFANPLKQTHVLFRVSTLLAACYSQLIDPVWSVQMVFATLGAFLMACDPLPPCRGKVWDQLGAALTTPSRSAAS